MTQLANVIASSAGETLTAVRVASGVGGAFFLDVETLTGTLGVSVQDLIDGRTWRTIALFADVTTTTNVKLMNVVPLGAPTPSNYLTSAVADGTLIPPWGNQMRVVYTVVTGPMTFTVQFVPV